MNATTVRCCTHALFRIQHVFSTRGCALDALRATVHKEDGRKDCAPSNVIPLNSIAAVLSRIRQPSGPRDIAPDFIIVFGLLRVHMMATAGGNSGLMSPLHNR